MSRAARSPRLVLVNGAPGSGKSTLARRYAADHPFSLALDLDELRAMLGGWSVDPVRAGRLTRALALAAGGAHLRAGHDVIVPQYLGRPEFIEELAVLAAEAGARFVEVALLVDPAELVRRFAHRSARPERPADRDADELLGREGGVVALPAIQERLHALLSTRPDVTVLPAEVGQREATYRALLDVVDSGA